MSNELRIDAFARLAEPVELLWLKGVFKDIDGNWHVHAVVELVKTGRHQSVNLPFGLMPILAPGRCFIDGRPSEIVRRGTIFNANIPDLRVFEEVSLADVPASVFSDGRPRSGSQLMYRYRTSAFDLFVPPLELVRRLFLHDKTLAYAILRPGGLWELLRYEKRGFFDEMTLHFTAAMPPRLLVKPFVREMAWIAIHPTGRRSWESVARLSKSESGIRLEPPKIEHSEWIFRGLGGGGAVLALEINRLSGKRDPCKQLFFNHPADRSKLAPRSGDISHSVDGKGSGLPNERFEKEFVVRDGSSHHHSDQDYFGISRNFSDFIDVSAKITRRVDDFFNESISDKEFYRFSNVVGDDFGGGSSSSMGVRRKLINVGVSDVSVISDVSPISFKILEPAPSDYIGTLGALIETLRRMQELIPAVHIHSSLCLVPIGKAISRVRHWRRPCLVAIFSRKNEPPVVLLDVDHTDVLGLSAIALRFRHAVTLEDLEINIKYVLCHLVNNSGKWSTDLEKSCMESVTIIRIKRVLRNDSKSDDGGYQTRWAILLAQRLGMRI